MSDRVHKVTFTTSEGRNVVAGFDRILNYCYLTIYNGNDVDYTSLNESDCFMWTRDEVFEKLEELGIEAFDAFREALRGHEKGYTTGVVAL